MPKYKSRLTDAQRVQRASIAANSRWGRTPPADRTKVTQPGRDAFQAKFEREADPDGTLDPAVRAKLAENLRRAYYQRMAFNREKARRQRRESGAA